MSKITRYTAEHELNKALLRFMRGYTFRVDYSKATKGGHVFDVTTIGKPGGESTSQAEVTGTETAAGQVVGVRVLAYTPPARKPTKNSSKRRRNTSDTRTSTGRSDVRSPTRTSTEVRSPTSTSTEVRSPTNTSTSTEVRSPTSTSTSTDAYTSGNVTVTGGAGNGANTTVHIHQTPHGRTQPRADEAAHLIRSQGAANANNMGRATSLMRATGSPRAKVPQSMPAIMGAVNRAPRTPSPIPRTMTALAAIPRKNPTRRRNHYFTVGQRCAETARAGLVARSGVVSATHAPDSYDIRWDNGESSYDVDGKKLRAAKALKEEMAWWDAGYEDALGRRRSRSLDVDYRSGYAEGILARSPAKNPRPAPRTSVKRRKNFRNVEGIDSFRNVEGIDSFRSAAAMLRSNPFKRTRAAISAVGRGARALTIGQAEAIAEIAQNDPEFMSFLLTSPATGAAANAMGPVGITALGAAALLEGYRAFQRKKTRDAKKRRNPARCNPTCKARHNGEPHEDYAELARAYRSIGRPAKAETYERKAREAAPGRGTQRNGSSSVQTLLFPRSGFTVKQAKAWAKAHKFRYGSVDSTAGFHRLRQWDPAEANRSTFGTIPFGESGIQAIVAVRR